jgi:hypothetical protein
MDLGVHFSLGDVIPCRVVLAVAERGPERLAMMGTAVAMGIEAVAIGQVCASSISNSASASGR